MILQEVPVVHTAFVRRFGICLRFNRSHFADVPGAAVCLFAGWTGMPERSCSVCVNGESDYLFPLSLERILPTVSVHVPAVPEIARWGFHNLLKYML